MGQTVYDWLLSHHQRNNTKDHGDEFPYRPCLIDSRRASDGATLAYRQRKANRMTKRILGTVACRVGEHLTKILPLPACHAHVAVRFLLARAVQCDKTRQHCPFPRLFCVGEHVRLISSLAKLTTNPEMRP